MNVTEIIAIKFQAHQHKHVTVHNTKLRNGNPVYNTSGRNLPHCFI